MCALQSTTLIRPAVFPFLPAKLFFCGLPLQMSSTHCGRAAFNQRRRRQRPGGTQRALLSGPSQGAKGKVKAVGLETHPLQREKEGPAPFSLRPFGQLDRGQQARTRAPREGNRKRSLSLSTSSSVVQSKNSLCLLSFLPLQSRQSEKFLRRRRLSPPSSLGGPPRPSPHPSQDPRGPSAEMEAPKSSCPLAHAACSLYGLSQSHCWLAEAIFFL